MSPRPVPRGRPARRGAGGDAADFLQAAGIDPSVMARDPAAAAAAGRTFRAMAVGLQALLRQLSEMKAILGVERTQIGLVNNNAFKFATSAEDLLARLLVPAEGDLPGEEAVARSLDDVRRHHERLLTAMTEAVRRIVERLSPQEIKRRETGGMMDKLIPGARKATWWDELEKEHAALLEEGGAKLDELIEGELRAAFEKHL